MPKPESVKDTYFGTDQAWQEYVMDGVDTLCDATATTPTATRYTPAC